MTDEVLRSRIEEAQAIRARHLRGTPPGMEDKCQCVGCEMGRALDGRQASTAPDHLPDNDESRGHEPVR